jgi:hypothetical protein
VHRPIAEALYSSTTQASQPSRSKANRLTLLLGHTDGTTAAASGLGVLSAHAQAPVVSQTTVSADLLQTLQIVTELAVNAVGEDLAVLAIDNIALSVEEPGGDFV